MYLFAASIIEEAIVKVIVRQGSTSYSGKLNVGERVTLFGEYAVTVIA